MIDPHFVFLGALLSLGGSSRYAWQTIRGRTQPNRVTWFLWTVAPAIGFVAALDDGVGLPAVLTLSVGLGPAIIFVSSFANRAAYWRISRFDLGCGAVSLIALGVYLSLDDPTPAIVFAVLADLMGGVPTIVKSWRSPASENPAVFALSGANGVITLLTIDHWDVATWAFPVYIVVIGIGLSLLIVVRGRRAHAPSRLGSARAA